MTSPQGHNRGFGIFFFFCIQNGGFTMKNIGFTMKNRGLTCLNIKKWRLNLRDLGWCSSLFVAGIINNLWRIWKYGDVVLINED
jgi:hypothetical protein